MSLRKDVLNILLKDFEVTSANIDRLFRHRIKILKNEAKIEITVQEIYWTDPGTPRAEWIPVKTVSNKKELPAAIADLLKNPSFFGYCQHCNRINVKGHMHKNYICQGCAERHLGILH